MLRKRPLLSFPWLCYRLRFFPCLSPISLLLHFLSENLFLVRSHCFVSIWFLLQLCLSLTLLPSDFHILFLNLTFSNGCSSSYPTPFVPYLSKLVFCRIIVFLGLWRAQAACICSFLLELCFAGASYSRSLWGCPGAYRVSSQDGWRS